MAFTPQTIDKELDMANLAKHNANFTAIKSELDAHGTHISAQTAHGSTSAATAGKIMQRDGSGRAKVSAPSASDDIARKAEVDAVQTNLTTHAADSNAHLTTADRTKFTGIRAGAEPNQNAFASINNVVASVESDALEIVGSTGITVSTSPTNKRVTITATGTSTPGAHGSTHGEGGADPIPEIVALQADMIEVNAQLADTSRFAYYTLTSVQSFASGVESVLLLTTKISHNGEKVTSITPNNEILISETGIYTVDFVITWNTRGTNINDYRTVSILRNNGGIAARETSIPINGFHSQSITRTFEVNANDVLKVVVTQSNSDTQALEILTAQTVFVIKKVG